MRNSAENTPESTLTVLSQAHPSRGVDGEVLTRSESETMELGSKLAAILKPGDVVALYGDLGSGKTRLVQGICRALEVRDDVTSPSFTLINEYRGRIPVYHFDFYRLQRVQEILALGLEEYFDGDGLCLIEWAERAAAVLPQRRLDIEFQMFPEPGRENERLIRLRWRGGRG